MFCQPHSIEEALELKRQHGGDAAFLAGGTDLIVMMNHGRMPAKVFIDVTHIPRFAEVHLELPDGTISSNPQELYNPPAGSRYVATGGATFAQLAALPVRCLSQASLSVGGPQIRNRATIAGNVASASPAGDGSTALLTLDTQVEMRSLDGIRTVPLTKFFHDYRKTELRDDEIISRMSFATDWKTAWRKLGKRGAMNISLVCCAASKSGAGEFHVAFGSVGPYPLYAPETGRFLTTNASSINMHESAAHDIIDEAVEKASEEVRPIDDFRGSAQYRRAMAGALLRKALRELLF